MISVVKLNRQQTNVTMTCKYTKSQACEHVCNLKYAFKTLKTNNNKKSGNLYVPPQLVHQRERRWGLCHILLLTRTV